jgi:hypothetical protein
MQTPTKMHKLPQTLDLTILEFLQHGDKERIAALDRESGHKTDRRYVSKVLKGKHSNHRILQLAFDIALERRGRFPHQAIKPTAHAA